VWVCISFRLPSRGVLTLFVRIVEFASQEDSQRAIRELSEQPLLGRPVFIREVRSNFLLHSKFDLDLSTSSQDRENESRFGATPVPGKIGMAMAGQGLTAGPPPRPAYHNSFGQNPGNQLYVGNVSVPAHRYRSEPQSFAVTLSSRVAGFERFIQVCGKHCPGRYQYRGRWSA
jgi:RNA recognition motif-containing protein